MSGSIGSGGTLPPFNATPIEQRVKAEYQAVLDGSDLQARFDEVHARYTKLSTQHDDAEEHANTMHSVKYMGIGAGIGATLLGAGGAIFGGSGTSRLISAGIGLGVGAAIGALGGGMARWLEDFEETSFGFDPSGDVRIELEPSPEFQRVGAEHTKLKRELEAQPDPERIEPGSAWLNVPRTAEHALNLGDDDVKVGAWVSQIMSAHDHDGDGELRIDDTSRTARNELLRAASGGPFSADIATSPEAIAKARTLPMAQQHAFDADDNGVVSDAEISDVLRTPKSTTDLFGLQASQLTRFDGDHSGTVSRAELAEGLVRDAATEAHAGYFITRPDGTIPTVVHDGSNTAHAFQAYG